MNILIKLLVFPAFVSVSLTSADRLPPEILSNYVQGVEHFNDTLNSLVNYKHGENLKAFFMELFQSVNSSYQSFSKSHEAASTQHNKLNYNQASVQSQLDDQRTNLKGKVAEGELKQIQLRADQQSLHQSERHLQNTEQNLRNRQWAVREAEKKVYKAKHCLHMRKKRDLDPGLLDELFNHILDPFEHLICGALNELFHDVEHKKALRDAIQRDLTNYRTVVAQARQAVQNTQTKLNALTREIQRVQASITSLNLQITKLKSEQTKIISLKEKISKVDQHLATVINRMNTSADAIKISQAALVIAEIEEAIDFENVILPLVEAGEVISEGFDTVVPELLLLTGENREKIVQNVQLLQKMLFSLQEAHGEDADLFSNLD